MVPNKRFAETKQCTRASSRRGKMDPVDIVTGAIILDMLVAADEHVPLLAERRAWLLSALASMFPDHLHDSFWFSPRRL